MPDIHAPATLPAGTTNRGFGGAVFFGLFAVLAVSATAYAACLAVLVVGPFATKRREKPHA